MLIGVTVAFGAAVVFTFAFPPDVADALRLLDAKESFPCFSAGAVDEDDDLDLGAILTVNGLAVVVVEM